MLIYSKVSVSILAGLRPTDIRRHSVSSFVTLWTASYFLKCFVFFFAFSLVFNNWNTYHRSYHIWDHTGFWPQKTLVALVVPYDKVHSHFTKTLKAKKPAVIQFKIQCSSPQSQNNKKWLTVQILLDSTLTPALFLTHTFLHTFFLSWIIQYS